MPSGIRRDIPGEKSLSFLQGSAKPVCRTGTKQVMGDADEELEWVRQSRDGHPEAFGELIRRYQQMINGLTYRMTGSLEDSEDLAQEVFIQAFRKLDSFRGDARFSTWLYQVAMNHCLNWKRRQKRRAEVMSEWRESQEDSGGAANPQCHAVQAALLELPPKQRAAILLTVYEGFNHAEAARVLDCSETTVSWRVFEARRKLKKILTR